jgi:hypothetical protein
MNSQAKQEERGADVPFPTLMRRIAFGLTSLWLLYSFIGQVVLSLYRAVVSTERQAGGTVLHAPPGGIVTTIVGGDGAVVGSAGHAGAEGALTPYLGLLAACAVAALILVAFVDYVCEQDWVKEKVEFKMCWKSVKWYNPWSWVKAFFCFVWEIIKQILREICKVFPRSVLFWTLVCFVSAIVALA